MGKGLGDSIRSEYLDAMGISQWNLREGAEDEPGHLEVTDNPREQGLETVDWAALQAQVSACTRCDLHKTRTQTVFGVGDQQADVLIIGEAPGADEDQQGEPFVGRAGQLLNEMLLAAGYQRSDVYIANVLKCRPPGNRNPRPEEMGCCQGWLRQQIEWIKPKLIIAVGGIAAHNLLQTEEAVGRLRGVTHCYGKQRIPLVVTYHPAYLLRSPLEKRKVWADLQFAQQLINSVAEDQATVSVLD